MRKALIIIAIAMLSLTAIGYTQFQGGDYFHHFQKASIGCPENGAFEQSACETYAPLVSILGSPFAFHEQAFFYFALIIIAFITPLVLYYISKDWTTVFFYFTVSNYVYYFLDGIYAQATANVLAMAVFLSRNPWYYLALLVLGSLAHGHGFLVVLLFITIKELLIHNNRFLVACSGVGSNITKNTPLKDTIPITAGGFAWTWADILHFFFKTFPFPFLLMGISGLWARGNTDKVVLTYVLIALGFLISPRVFYLIPLIGVIGMSYYYRMVSRRGRHILLATALIMGALQFYWFIVFKTCVGS